MSAAPEPPGRFPRTARERPLLGLGSGRWRLPTGALVGSLVVHTGAALALGWTLLVAQRPGTRAEAPWRLALGQDELAQAASQALADPEPDWNTAAPLELEPPTDPLVHGEPQEPLTESPPAQDRSTAVAAVWPSLPPPLDLRRLSKPIQPAAAQTPAAQADPTDQAAPTTEPPSAEQPAAPQASPASPQGSGDSPPILVQAPDPDYPRRARDLGQQGDAVVAMEIAADGRVAAAHVQTSTGFPLLDRAALEAVHRWRFEPLESPSKPETRRYVHRFQFRLGAP